MLNIISPFQSQFNSLSLSLSFSHTMASSVSSSSILCNRIHNLTFTHTSISLTTNFPQRPISHKPISFTLRPQSFNLFTPPPLHRPSSAFDGFQVAQDTDDITVSQQDEQEIEPETEPETESETSEKPEKEEEEQNNVSDSNDSGRLYVGNLPYSTTSNNLAELFAEAGTVVSAEIVYDRVTDRSRGFAFVTMGSVEEAKEAIRMFDGSQIGGRTVRVNFPEVPKGGERLVMGPKIRSNYKGFVDSPHKIYAGNLGWRLTSEGLRDAFAEQPGIMSAKVIYERDSGRSRGFGFVTFQTAEDVEAALNAMNGVEIEGRPLRLNLAAERAPSSSPAIEANTGSDVDSSELLSSVST